MHGCCPTFPTKNIACQEENFANFYSPVTSFSTNSYEIKVKRLQKLPRLDIYAFIQQSLAEMIQVEYPEKKL